MELPNPWNIEHLRSFILRGMVVMNFFLCNTIAPVCEDQSGGGPPS
jgi:hypothetical protein